MSEKPYIRVTIETHDSLLVLDTRQGAKHIEARAVEAIRAGCVGIYIAEEERKREEQPNE